MQLRNTPQHYGAISIVIHWAMAVLIVGLFILGLYMTELDYYDPWYKRAPDIHRSLGIIMLILLLFRLAWRQLNPKPAPVDNDPEHLHKLAEWVHGLLYLLLFAIALSGYLISTADGRGIDVFNWFTVPALFPSFENMEDLAGEVHFILAITLIALVSLHAVAALKHHFIDRDLTLMRMLGTHRSLDR
ncbi:MAG: cytochrome b [Sedimenticola sp.]|uniref:Cytochrome b n=1 Tax=Sedimenticola thiotaurini TaxID=1543721 RepID=A0A558D2R5_9GAMM|nr:cytochrome b [Sedimenticola sp.]TVT55253.1 MAG: cytochrome b [Sedimenticola thiotaurini]MCW8881807.1 cytochrome b [Sedimenticola sp.]MCW8920467.1 cytochrome b [Sedimenticola sp.]MCW8948267.1 cytochrome b [Sedimenticola sp.]